MTVEVVDKLRLTLCIACKKLYRTVTVAAHSFAAIHQRANHRITQKTMQLGRRKRG